MNSLHKLSVCAKHLAFALMIVFCLTALVSAQRVTSTAPQQQGKMYGDPGFRGEPINLNVVNADIRDILNYITEQYGINFVIDKSVDKVPVTVNVSEVPWNVALDSILQAQELGVQVNGSILRVAQAKNLAAEGEVRRQRQENQLDTSPLYTEFIRLNYAFGNGSLSGQSGGAGAFVGGVTPSVGGNGGAVGASGNDQGIMGIIKRRLSRRGAVEVDSRSNTLIITDVRENIDAVRQLVALLDQPEPQVEIEARIVIATRTFSRDLGVALSALVLGPRGSGASGATLPGSQAATGTGGAGGGGQNTTGFRPNGIPVGIGSAPNNSLLSSIPNTVIGLTTGIFGTAQISALITAGENKGQAKTIATPRVTTLNNRPAQIESGSQIPITTIQPGSGVGAPVATTEYVNVPLRLAVTPQITDVGTVILNVVAENNTAQAGGAISTQRMQTQVMVPDGGTTVVGGALLDSEREEVDRTPGLSRIPVLGNLFKRKGVFRDSSEILFFITPRIFRPDFAGNQTPGRISDGMRSTTIMQPVPLGNPPSNSENAPVAPNQTNPSSVVPAVPVVTATEVRPAGSSAKP
jgi:type IV pilus assembly protein PilQ